MKSVLILGNNACGLYSFRKEIIKALIKDGHYIYFSTPDKTSPFVEKLKNLGTHFIEADIDRRGINPFKDLILFIKYIIILLKIKPDVVLGYTIKPNIYGSLAAQVLGIDYANNVTGLGSSLQKNNFVSKLLKQMYKWAFKKSKCIFFQNEENLNFFLENKLIKDIKTEVIPGSGVNLKEFYPIPRTATSSYPTFLFIGRIMKDKGINEYLEAARLIIEEGYNVEFQILGPLEEDYWIAKIKEYEKEGYIKYLGASSDVREQIKNCDCVVNPSHHEGMSNVLLEAGAMGKILLGSNISGIKEIITPLGNDYLFEKGDILDLKKKILSILLLKEKYILGQMFRKHIILNFDRKEIVKTYVNFIKMR